MPALLKVMVAPLFVLGPLFLILPCLPYCNIGVLGEQLTFRELWKYGYGPFIILTGLVSLVAGICMLQGRSWSRWLLVFFCALEIPVLFIHCLRHPEKCGTLIAQVVVEGGAWAGFSYWYLFRRESVKRLFS